MLGLDLVESHPVEDIMAVLLERGHHAFTNDLHRFHHVTADRKVGRGTEENHKCEKHDVPEQRAVFTGLAATDDFCLGWDGTFRGVLRGGHHRKLIIYIIFVCHKSKRIECIVSGQTISSPWAELKLNEYGAFS